MDTTEIPSVVGTDQDVKYRKQYIGGIHAVLRFTPILYPIIAVSIAFALASRQSFELLIAYLVGFAVVSLIVKIIKKIAKQDRPKHKLLDPTGKHTDEEEQCSHIFKFANRNDADVSQSRQMTKKEKGHGMPSGHAALSAYTLVFLALTIANMSGDDIVDVRSWKTRGYLIGAMIVAFLCLGTIYHRIMLICHTPAQVVVGALVGALVAFGIFYLIKFVQKQNVIGKWLGEGDR